MKNKSKSAPRSQCGFTLAETMIAVALMSLVGLIVAGGIMTASRVYGRIQDRANAELLLSTTLIEMRNELDRAEEIYVSRSDTSTRLLYRTSTGNWREILSDGEDGIDGIKVQEYTGYIPNLTAKGEAAPLVSEAAASKGELYAVFTGFTATQETTPPTPLPAADEHGVLAGVLTRDNVVFCVEGLEVRKKSTSQKLAEVGTDDGKYYIRSLEQVQDYSGVGTIPS